MINHLWSKVLLLSKRVPDKERKEKRDKTDSSKDWVEPTIKRSVEEKFLSTKRREGERRDPEPNLGVTEGREGLTCPKTP